MPLTITEEMIKQDPFFEMGLKRGLEKGKEIGLKEGRKLEKKLLIKRLINKGKSIEEISELLDISKKEIKELLEEK